MPTSYLATGPYPATTTSEVGRGWAPDLVDVPAGQRANPRRRGRGEVLNTVIDVLAKLGFDPEAPADPGIRLPHRPFLELITDFSAPPDRHSGGSHETICLLQLGLMQGAFAALGGPITADSLDPCVQPELCLAHAVAVAPLGDTGVSKTRSGPVARGTKQ